MPGWDEAKKLAREALAEGEDPAEVMQALQERAAKEGVNWETEKREFDAPAPKPVGLVVQEPPKPQRIKTQAEPVDVRGLGHVPSYWYEVGQRGDEKDVDYRKRADDAWMGEVEKAEREGYRVKRWRDTTGVERYAAAVPGVLGAATMGASQGYSMGIYDRLAGLINPEAHENLKKIQSGEVQVPLGQELAIATEMLGALHPRSLSARVVGPIMGAAGATAEGASKLARLATNAVAGGLGGVADSVARSGVDAAGNYLQDQPQEESWGDAAINALASGGLGTLLGPLAAIPMRGARSLVEHLRGTPQTGSRLNNAEQGGVRTGITGLDPPPTIQDAQRMQAAGRETDPAKIAANPELRFHGREAEDISTTKAAEAFHGRFKQHREGTKASIAQERAPYYQSPQGLEEVSVGPVVDALQARIAKGIGNDGRPLPGYDTLDEDLRILGKLQNGTFREAGDFNPDTAIEVREARLRGIPLDDEVIGDRARQLVDRRIVDPNVRTQTMGADGRTLTGMRTNPADRTTIDTLRKQGYQFDEPKMQEDMRKGLEASGGVELQDRTLNAEQLERAIKEYRDTVTNKRVSSTKHEAEDLVEAELIRLRSQFKPNEFAPAETGGYAGMQERQHQKMVKLEDLAGSTGQDRRIDRVELTDPDQRARAFQFARTFRQAGVSPHEDSPAVREFWAENPDILHLFETAAAHRDMNALNRDKAPLYIGGGGDSISLFGTLQQFARWGAIHADPLLQRAAGVERTNMAARKGPPQDPGAIEDTRAYKAGQRAGATAPGRAVVAAGKGVARAANAVRSRLPGQLSQEAAAKAGGRDDLTQLGARAVIPAPKTPNEPTKAKQAYDRVFERDHYPDKKTGAGKAASRGARVASDAVSQRDAEADVQWLFEAYQTLKEDSERK